MMTTPLFREIEHTADLAILVEGADRADLFARAGLSLYALLVERGGVCAVGSRRVSVSGEGMEDLLHEWLARLLTDFYVDGWIGAQIEVHALETDRIEADVHGEVLERGRHEVLREIKAVTYHDLRVEPADGGWQASITFDV